MGFLADVESRDEARGPIWGPFAIIRDNVERLVALNLGWSAQLLPGFVALAVPSLPLWLRVALALSSATVVIPTTGALYALCLDATRGEHLSLELALHRLRQLAIPSFRALTPLCGIFGALITLAVVVGSTMPAVTTLATLAGLLWYLCAIYWGPLLVCRRELSAASLAGHSVRLVWRYPAETLATALVAAVALAVGMVSVGGLVLIVPVIVALLHSQRYLELAAREGLTTMGE
jgi:hypothetical protein